MGVVRRDSGGRPAVISAMISASRAEKRTETDRQTDRPGAKRSKEKKKEALNLCFSFTCSPASLVALCSVA